MNNHGPIKIFSGTAGLPMAEEVSKLISVELGQQDVGRHNDGEVFANPAENVRGCDAFVINPTCAPAENLQEVLTLGRALRGSSASRVTAVIPYFGYARSDKKDKPRVAIAARLVADQLCNAGFHRFLLLDLHADQIVGFFDPFLQSDHLHASYVTVEYLRERFSGTRHVVASPDAGGVARASRFADFLGVDLVIFNKKRPRPGEVDEKETKIIGDVKGSTVLFVDDIIDTGGTMRAGAKAAKAAGATYVSCFATHGLFSNDALKKFAQSDVDEVIVTNTVPTNLPQRTIRGLKFGIVSAAPLLAKAISRLNHDQSLSDLFIDH